MSWDPDEMHLVTPPDNVLAAQRWCEQHPGTWIDFEDGRFIARRGREVIVTAPDLAVLLGKLERDGSLSGG
jgi:hypothetical protein